MADVKNKTSKGNKNFFARVGQFFVNLPKNLSKAFKNMAGELRKVTWPTKKVLIRCTIMVIAFVVFMGIVITAIDLLSSGFITAIMK